MDKRWVLNKNGDSHVAGYLMGVLNLSYPLAMLLTQRGVNTIEEAKSFFRPSLQDVHDPFLMKDMKKAVERVQKAIAENESILIFGDYDVDGTSAVALMYSYLNQFVDKIEYYVPDRYEEGYGISNLSIEYAKEKQFTLMIVLDCGIKCHEEIDLANRYGIDVIVCDHHLPDDNLPKAYAILDPKRPDCLYPYKELTGCGVGFKLVQAMASLQGKTLEDMMEYFDLLVISIASDVVPITGENRVFAFFGLNKINKKPRQGIESLLKSGKINRKPEQSYSPEVTTAIAQLPFNIRRELEENANAQLKDLIELPRKTRKVFVDLPLYFMQDFNSLPNKTKKTLSDMTLLMLKKLESLSPEARKAIAEMPTTITIFTREVTVNDLVFCVGPRINAAGRMDTGRSSVHLLISDKEEKVNELGEIVEMHNRERRELDQKTTEEAISMMEKCPNMETKKSIVAYNAQWSKGVVGIVASRLVEHFYRPSIVLTQSNGLITGSARSVKDFDLYEALCQCQDLLEHFGGHKYAAGLGLLPQNLEPFMDRFETLVSQSLTAHDMIPEIDIDVEIQLHDINLDFFKWMKKFAPFGPQNMNPTFITKGVLDVGHAKIVGQNHLKLSLFQPNSRSYPIGAVGFGLGEHYDRILEGKPFHICYHIDINEWQGKSYLQLILKDIKFDFDRFDSI